MRRDSQHALAAPDQKSLQRPRHVPAVLKHPHPPAFEASRPPQQGTESALADRDGLLTQQLAGRGRDGRDGVRTLVGVRAEHDHDPRPPLPRQRRTPGGQSLREATPRIYQVTPDIPRPATSDKTKGSQALTRPTASMRVSSPPGRDLLRRVGRHRPPNRNSKPRCDTAAARGSAPRWCARANPSPTAASNRGCATVRQRRGRRPPPGNPAARHRRPAGDATGRPQPATGAPSSPARRPDSPCLLHGLSPASPRGPREMRQAPVSVGDQNSRPRAPTRRPERASAGGRLRRPSVVLRGCARRVARGDRIQAESSSA